MITAQDNKCIYADSTGVFAEATTNTVIYLSHTGTTSATLTDFGIITRLTCASYNHSAFVHWIAYP